MYHKKSTTMLGSKVKPLNTEFTPRGDKRARDAT